MKTFTHGQFIISSFTCTEVYTYSILNYTSSTNADKLLKHRIELWYSLFYYIFNSYVDAYGIIYHKNSKNEDNNPPSENTKSLAKKERKK